MPRFRRAALSAACLLTLLSGVARAQYANANASGHAKDRATVIILATDHLEGARARILLKANGRSEAVIAVPRASVTEEDLAEAFFLVAHAHKKMRELRASAANKVLRLDLTSPHGTRQLTDAERGSYRRYLTLLKSASEIDLKGIGRGRALEVTIPEWN